MGKLTWFRNPIRDVRKRKITMGKIIQVEPNVDFNMTFWPRLSMWFHNGTFVENDNTHLRSCGLTVSFLFWNVDIFDYSYSAKWRGPWIEDLKGNYIQSAADYYRKQKH